MKIKEKIFASGFSDITVEVSESGYITLIDGDKKSILLGNPPNARIDLILEAIKYVEAKKE